MVLRKSLRIFGVCCGWWTLCFLFICSVLWEFLGSCRPGNRATGDRRTGRHPGRILGSAARPLVSSAECQWQIGFDRLGIESPGVHPRICLGRGKGQGDGGLAAFKLGEGRIVVFVARATVDGHERRQRGRPIRRPWRTPPSRSECLPDAVDRDSRRPIPLDTKTHTVPLATTPSSWLAPSSSQPQVRLACPRDQSMLPSRQKVSVGRLGARRSVAVDWRRTFFPPGWRHVFEAEPIGR